MKKNIFIIILLVMVLLEGICFVYMSSYYKKLYNVKDEEKAEVIIKYEKVSDNVIQVVNEYLSARYNYNTMETNSVWENVKQYMTDKCYKNIVPEIDENVDLSTIKKYNYTYSLKGADLYVNFSDELTANVFSIITYSFKSSASENDRKEYQNIEVIFEEGKWIVNDIRTLNLIEY